MSEPMIRLGRFCQRGVCQRAPVVRDSTGGEWCARHQVPADLEPMIRFATFEPCIITADEYEQIQRDVMARGIAGDAGPGDRVLAALLRDHAIRYHEIKPGGA